MLFFAIRKLIAKEYSGLFTEEGEEEGNTPRRPGQTAKPNAARSWWGLLNLLAGGNPLEFEKASVLPIRSAFNWIAWKRDEIRKHHLAVQAQTKHQVR
jgi:hypothetical protein